MTVAVDRQSLEAWLPEAISIRQRIHQHPELGFEEQHTQAMVVDELKKYGVDHIDTDFAKTAVVAVIAGQLGEGPTIGLRAHGSFMARQC